MILGGASIEISRPQDAVFEFVDDDAKAAQWLGMCHSLEMRSAPPKRVGTALCYSFREGRRVRSMEGSVTAHERPRRLEMTFADKAFEIDVSYGLEPSGAGTRLEARLVIRPRSMLMKLMSPLIRMATQKQLANDVAKLKRLLESAAP